MNIMIGGDLVPTKSNIDLFEKGEISKNIDSNFLKLWNAADYRVFNLETPISDTINPLLKTGPNLVCSTKSINGIKELNPNLILLSNNHILDQSIEGLDSTVKVLKDNKIPYVGIVNNIKEKNKAYYFEKKGIKVGVYNICDNEFSVATMTRKGTSGLNIFKSYEEIKDIKKNCNYLIVVYHGGKEFYRYPSPYLKELCEFFTKIGADIVICQHSHCIGAQEKLDDKTIIYGQGNFIFDNCGQEEFQKNSLILNLNFAKEGYTIEYIPIEKDNSLIKLSDDKSILKDFYERSSKVCDDDFLEKEFEKFSMDKLNGFIATFHRRTFLGNVLDKVKKHNHYLSLYSKKNLIAVLNITECAAIRETIITGLKKRIKNK